MVTELAGSTSGNVPHLDQHLSLQNSLSAMPRTGEPKPSSNSLFYIYCLNLVDLDPKKKKTKLNKQPKRLSPFESYI